MKASRIVMGSLNSGEEMITLVEDSSEFNSRTFRQYLDRWSFCNPTQDQQSPHRRVVVLQCRIKKSIARLRLLHSQRLSALQQAVGIIP
jgi:hypothetical protein